MLVELLALLGLKGVTGIGRAVDDAKSKRDTAKLDANGNVTCFGRTGKYYINGEETYRWTETDKYGNEHNLLIGVNSGKVYRDSYDFVAKRAEETSEQNKQQSIKGGYLSYNKYDPRFDRYVTTEISTGKIIAALCEELDEHGRGEKFYKFYYKERYLPSGAFDRFSFDKTAPGDYGIEISEEEFNKLKIVTRTCGSLPSDPQVKNKIMHVDCFY